MKIDTLTTPTRHPKVTEAEHQALLRLIRIAQSDTGHGRKVSGFLLAWWDPIDLGRFDLLDLWSMDRPVVNDVLVVLQLLVRAEEYPDTLGYKSAFGGVVSQWRKMHSK